MQVIVEIPGLPRLEAGLAAAPRVLEAEEANAMRRSTLIVEAEAKRRTPRRTGRLGSAWTPEVVGIGPSLTGRVFNTVEYGPFVEEGTGPHLIEAREKRALYWKGAQHPVRSVHHPGTKGRHMARDTAEASGPLVLTEFAAAAVKALEVVRA